jgi:glutathione synthase/RimK-type ligase-like ATP-grasp enzyme
MHCKKFVFPLVLKPLLGSGGSTALLLKTLSTCGDPL